MSNFQKRTLTTIIGGAIMIGLLFMGGILLLAALLVVSLVGYYELTKACKVKEDNNKYNALVVVGWISAIAWYTAIGLIEFGGLKIDTLGAGLVILVLSLMSFMAVYVISFPRFDANQVMSALFGLIYCPVMLSFVYLVRALEYGVFLVWMVFVCSWICDICAYLVGIKFGRRKMAPKLSPKKSIEGAIGGVAGSAIVGAVYAAFVLTPNVGSDSMGTIVAIIVCISVIGALFSMVGDLAASAIKRNHDIKDYGNLIPGHGGVMDRFDSVIFLAPVVYLLSLIFLMIIGA